MIECGSAGGGVSYESTVRRANFSRSFFTPTLANSTVALASSPDPVSATTWPRPKRGCSTCDPTWIDPEAGEAPCGRETGCARPPLVSAESRRRQLPPSRRSCWRVRGESGSTAGSGRRGCVIFGCGSARNCEATGLLFCHRDDCCDRKLSSQDLLPVEDRRKLSPPCDCRKPPEEAGLSPCCVR